MRRLSLVLLLASVASAQTYVRPSKGAAISPFAVSGEFTTNTFNGTTWTHPQANVGAYPKRVEMFSRRYDWTAFNGVRITRISSDCQSQDSTSSTVVYREVQSYIAIQFNIEGADGSTSSAKYSMILRGGATPENINQIDNSLNGDPTMNGVVDLGYSSQLCRKVELILTPLPFTTESTVNLESSSTIDTRDAASWCRSSSNRRIQFGVPHPTTNQNSLVWTGSDIFAADSSVYYNESPALNSGVNQYIKLCHSPLSPYGVIMCRRLPHAFGDFATFYTWQYSGTNNMFAEFVNPEGTATGTVSMLTPGQCVEYNFGPYWDKKNKQMPIFFPSDNTQDFQCAGNQGLTLDVTICRQQLY